MTCNFRLVQLGMAFSAIQLLAVCSAEARCTINTATVSPLSASAGTYTPPTTPTAQAVSFAISGNYSTNNGGLTCRVAIAFNRASTPATMARSGGGATLPYAIQTTSAGGNSLIFTGGGVPGTANRLLTTFTAAGTNLTNRAYSISVTIYFLQQPATNQQQGSYSDGPTVRTYNVTGGGVATQVGSSAFTVSAAVASSCLINNATAGTTDTSTIPVSALGVVNTAPIPKSYANVVCNSVTNLVASSQSGGVKNTGTAPSGFTNIINYSASATYGGATSTLNTATTATATGVETGTTGTTAATTTSGTLSVTITPQVPALKLLKGSYSDVLRITVTAQ